MSFIETSALDSTNVESAFHRIISEIYQIKKKQGALAEDKTERKEMCGKPVITHQPPIKKEKTYGCYCQM